MEDFSIMEISAVDRPAQKGARMTIMKRDFTAEERERLAESGAAMPDGSFPIATTADLKNAVEAYGRAKDKDAAKKHIIARARALDAVDSLPEDWEVKKLDATIEVIAKRWIDPADGAKPFGDFMAERIRSTRFSEVQEELWPLFSSMQDSVTSILGDASLSADARMLMTRNSVEEFLNAVREKIPAVEAELTELIAAGASAGDHIGKKETPMPDDVKKVADLEKQVADLNSRLTNILTMSKADRDHLDELEGDEKEKYLRMSPEERKAKVKKSTEDNPVVFKSADGTEFRKSDDPRLVDMAKRADESDKIAKDERDKREMSDLTKRASDEFGHLPGTPVAKAAILKAMGTMTEEVRKDLEGILKAAEKMVASGFAMKGVMDGSTADTSSPEAQLKKRAEEIQKAESISYEKAYSKAMEQNPDLYAQITTPAATQP
jgi:hypothetical protein